MKAINKTIFCSIYFFAFITILYLNGMESFYDISPSMIIERPCEVLEDSMSCFRKVHEERNEIIQQSSDNLILYAEKMRAACKKHQISLLLTEDYSVMPHGDVIKYPLSRKHYPLLRNAYEEKISTLLLDSLQKSSHNKVAYTAFGSDLFPCFRSIVKTLLQKPNAHIRVNIIDGACLCSKIKEDIYRETGKNILRKVDTLIPYFQRITQLLTNDYFSLLGNGGGKHGIIDSMILFHTMKKQFNIWIKKYFPLSQCSIFLYSSITHYFDEIDKLNFPYADVISAINLCKLYSQVSYPYLCDYALLCVYSLEEKEYASNCYLDYQEYGKYETSQVPPTFFEFILERSEEECKELKIGLKLFYLKKRLVDIL